MGPICESLRLYSLCKGMEWSHLPEPGGLYDQHPKLLDDWHEITGICHSVETDKQAKEQRKSGLSRGRRKSR